MPSRTRSAPPWATIAVLALCGMVVSLQQTLVIPLLPEFPQILGVSADDSSWLVTATLLSSAIFTPIVSRMADMYGKRKMLVLALAVMTVGSLIAAVGGSFAALIVGRALQGFASSLIPVGISILRDELPKERVGSAVALMSATLGIGGALGLPLSGLLYNQFGWESLFWFSAVAGMVFITGVLLLVKESGLFTPGRFDVLGALVLSVILTAALLAISKGAVWGWGSPRVLGLAALAVVLLGAWIPLQLRINQPMVDLRTAVKRPVLLTNIASLFLCFAMFANMLVTTQQLQLPVATGYGFGLTVVAAGLAMVPSGLVMVVLAPIAGTMLNRWGGKVTMIFGSAIMGLSYIGRVFFDDSVPQIVVGATLVNVGVALAFAAMPTLIMAAVPITETASANGVNSLVRSIGTSVASAVIGLVLSAMVLTYDGVPHPSPAALHLCFWLAVAASAVGIAVALFIPARRARLAGADSRETMVHGRVLLGAEGQRRLPAVVSFVREDGTPADWARADHDGRYAAVLPGPGRYLVIANAGGWSPRSTVVEISDGKTEQDITLLEELSLTGTVTQDGVPLAGAPVALNSAAGDFVGFTRTDDAGAYRMALPPVGTYIVTAAETAGPAAASVKVILRVRSERLDIQVPG